MRTIRRNDARAYSVKGDMFMAEKPRLWRANFSGTDFDLAKRLAVVVQTEAAQPEREAVRSDLASQGSSGAHKRNSNYSARARWSV